SYTVMTAPDKYSVVREAIETAKIPVTNGEVTLVPENTVPVSGHTAEQVLKLIEELEEHDDVQSVSANFDISDEEMAQISAA
ncbi:MAG: YebC/PmpR family DNA-binding transcriptional regulator, partial [Candidatus Binataceae bacterium]